MCVHRCLSQNVKLTLVLGLMAFFTLSKLVASIRSHEIPMRDVILEKRRLVPP